MKITNVKFDIWINPEEGGKQLNEI